MKWLWAAILVWGCADARSSGVSLSDAGAESPVQSEGRSRGEPVEIPIGSVSPDPNLQPPLITDPPLIADPPREICDGSSAVRLYLNSAGGGGLIRPGMDFTSLSYVIVTGECRFWVMQGTRDEARTGTLTREAAERLADELHYAAWYRLSDDQLRHDTVFDAGGGPVLTDGSRKFGCGAFCADSLVREMFERAYRLPQELYPLGEPVLGPMRVSAVDNSSFQGTFQKNTIDWPLSEPVERFVYDPSAQPAPGPNRGVLLESPADVKTLRALRPRLHGSDYGYIPVSADLDAADGGTATANYELYFRDVIPFEDPTTGELRPF
jgi:hypothetical protein